MARRKIEVTTWDECLDVLDGKHLVLDGIDGHIKVERPRPSPYYGTTLTRVIHNASAKGRKSDEYRKIKQKLGDDWSTDLTSGERVGEIANLFCTFKNRY